jgi:hypothetical protein
MAAMVVEITAGDCLENHALRQALNPRAQCDTEACDESGIQLAQGYDYTQRECGRCWR